MVTYSGHHRQYKEPSVRLHQAVGTAQAASGGVYALGGRAREALQQQVLSKEHGEAQGVPFPSPKWRPLSQRAARSFARVWKRVQWKRGGLSGSRVWSEDERTLALCV